MAENKKYNSEYFEKFKSPKWQAKRLEILNRDGFKCTRCNDNKETLHVHHRIYYKHLEPWEYDNHLLTTLCDICHTAHHEEYVSNRFLDFLHKNGLTEMNLEIEESCYFSLKRNPTERECMEYLIELLIDKLD